MVGVPRSQGCALCVKRRVKCDQARPGCGNCRKYGADCPGYDRGLKFVAGKHHVRTRRQKQVPAEAELEFDLASRKQTHDRLSSSDLLAMGLAQYSQDAIDFAVPRDMTNIRPQYIYAMLDNLYTVQNRVEVMYLAPWFTLVPQFVGNKPQLDSAMTAFTLHLLGKSKQDARIVGESRALYGQSLMTLQKALNHPTEWRSSETLCATMTLCLFELFAGTIDAESWMRHATGVGRLIQQRGPDEYKTPLDRSLLLSFRPIIIMNSLFSGYDCFLAKKTWQGTLNDVFTEHIASASPGGLLADQLIPREAMLTIEGYFRNLARLPTVLRYGYELRESRRHGMHIDQEAVVKLLKQTKAIRADVLEWFGEFEKFAIPPIEVPSQDPTSVHPTVLQYANPWIGSLFMGYWATMLIVQEIINQCQDKVSYIESNRLFAGNIYRSLETVGAGVMGPFRVGYAMRIAYDFADLDTQHWLQGLLGRYEQTYAATSPSTYPIPGQNENKFR